MWSCSLSFRCRSFSAWWQLAFLLFLTAAIKVLCFSSNEIGLLWFLSFALPLCLLSTSMQTLKLSRKKESAFVVVVFISKGWTYGLTYPVRTIFSEPKFLGCIDLPSFLTHGAPLHALRALESSANTDEDDDDDDDDQNKKTNKQQIIESLVQQFSRRA